jgi:hypothetical protein
MQELVLRLGRMHQKKERKKKARIAQLSRICFSYFLFHSYLYSAPNSDRTGTVKAALHYRILIFLSCACASLWKGRSANAASGLGHIIVFFQSCGCYYSLHSPCSIPTSDIAY